MKSFEIIAKTLFGLEEVLANELKELGALDIEIVNRAVIYTGDLELLYKSNLYLRTAIKILVPIATFNCNNEQELYDGVRDIRWNQFMTADQTLAVDGTTTGTIFTHSKYVALKTKDAIVDQFRDAIGKRPSVDTESPDLQINVHISDTSCTISLDSSGIPLGKRGYRLNQTIAPLSEVLAAGIILLSGWDKQSDFMDPMCGSGTFPIEAAMIASNTPAGRLRNFCFERWNDFNSTLWQRIKRESVAQIKPIEFKIKGQDIDSYAIDIASKNAQRAGFANNIRFEKQDFMLSKNVMKNGIVIINPPYGERLNESEDMVAFYKEIGSILKKFYTGCDAWIISGNLNAIKFVGLKPSKKITLFNGPIESRLHKFELYQGSREEKKPDLE